jgi:hypothetical protein
MGALFISLEVRALGRLGMSIGLRFGPGGAGDWVFAFLHFGDTCIWSSWKQYSMFKIWVHSLNDVTSSAIASPPIEWPVQERRHNL